MTLSSLLAPAATRRLRILVCGVEDSPVVEGVGGLEHCLLGWAGAVAARHEVILASVGEGAYIADVEYRRLRDPRRDPGPYGGRIPWGEPYRLPGEPFTRVALASPADLGDFALAEGVDVVSLHNSPAWVSALPVPAALTLHNAPDAWSGPGRPDPAQVSAGLAVASAVSAVSEHLLGVVADLADRDDLVVTYPFAHDRFLAAPPRPRQRAVLYASRLEPKKGVVDLAAAWRRLPASERPPAHVVDFAGGDVDASELDDLRSLLRSTPGMSVLPAPITRAEMAALVADHAVVVLPAVWDEPFGMLSVEAQAAGVMVVAYDSGGLVETFGPNARPVPRGDLHRLAETVLATIDATPDPGGRDWVAERFSLERSAAAFEALLAAAAG